MIKSSGLFLVVMGIILLFLFPGCLQSRDNQVTIDEKSSDTGSPNREISASGTSSSRSSSQNDRENHNGGDPSSLPHKNNMQIDIQFKHNEKDDAQMVLIPAGEFQMGVSPGDEMAKSDEKPLHKVWLDSYYIYTREVANKDFSRFISKTGYFTTAETRGEKTNWRDREFEFRLDSPVVRVSYEDAAAYCKWAGGRLPTEAEWEKAARGPNDTRIFPWGSKMNQDYFNSDMLSFNKYQTVREGRGIYRTPCRTGMFDKGNSPFEVQDMMGNVWEWCFDWYDMEYYRNSPCKNPTGPETGKYRVLKGGGMTANLMDFRISNRRYDLPDAINPEYGFRCVVEVREEITPIDNN